MPTLPSLVIFCAPDAVLKKELFIHLASLNIAINDAKGLDKRLNIPINDHPMSKRQVLQNRAAQTIYTGAHYLTPTDQLLNKLGWYNLRGRRNKRKILMMLKITKGVSPVYLKEVSSRKSPVYHLRTS